MRSVVNLTFCVLCFYFIISSFVSCRIKERGEASLFLPTEDVFFKKNSDALLASEIINSEEYLHRLENICNAQNGSNLEINVKSGIEDNYLFYTIEILGSDEKIDNNFVKIKSRELLLEEMGLGGYEGGQMREGWSVLEN